MGNIIICSMTWYDIPEVLEIEKLSFKVPWSRDAFESEVQRNMSARYIVAKLDGKVIAYAGMWVILDEGHITNIAVHPDYRGMHVGDKILYSLINAARREKVRALTLEVRRTNTVAQKLYTKYGFKPEGVRPKYYADNGEDAIIMWNHEI